MQLSIVITCCNDNEQCRETILSIRATAGYEPEILVIDDCSATPLSAGYITDDLQVKLIANTHRCGCGPSRTIGAHHATGDWLLIIDSHMRFLPGWYQEAEKCIKSQDALTLWCATCLGLDSDHMDPNHPVAEYRGATMNFFGPDRNKPSQNQVFEAVWIPKENHPKGNDVIPAIMGAAYFINRAWFHELGGLCYLRSWGCDEQILSLKAWMSGGDVRLMHDVRIGHKFLLAKERQGFRPPPGHVLWNKMFAISTLLPPNHAQTLLERLAASVPRDEQLDLKVATEMFKADCHTIAVERARNNALFTKSLSWYLKEFNITF